MGTDGEYKTTGKIGVYSGNEILSEKDGDTRVLEEWEFDTDQQKELWLDDILNDEEFYEDMVDEIQLMREKMDLPESFLADIRVVTQSHIDIAWLWRYAQTRRKGIRTYTKAVYHAKRFPDNFIFAASEPVLLDWIREDDPGLFRYIQQAQKNGQIELVGGAWVEPDCMMPSGEAFIRQRLYGMRFYRDYFGELPKVEWFLDSFGYNAGLPQLLLKSGAEYFWTNKMSWNLNTTFPFVYNYWESLDGSRILTANFPQNRGLFTEFKKFQVGRYQLKADAQRKWDYSDDYSALEENVDKDKLIPVIGWFNGKGDGGHGPTHQEVAEIQALIRKGTEAGLKFQWSKVIDTFLEIEKYGGSLPIWADEMYLENHRGTFSVHSEVKRHNRRLENLIQTTEILSTITSIFSPSFQYPSELIETTWKIILQNQFHDVLPGSSIPEVYDDVYDLWLECDKNITLLQTKCLQQYKADTGANIILFNPLPWERNERIFIPMATVEFEVSLDANRKPPVGILTIKNKDMVIECDCQPVAAESHDKMFNNPAGWWTIVKIPAYGIVSGTLALTKKGKNKHLYATLTPQPKISNHLLSVTLDSKTGLIKELKSKHIANSTNLVHGTKNLEITGYLDQSSKFPAWNLHPEYWKYPKKYLQYKDVTISIQDVGPIFVSLKIVKTLGVSQIEQSLRLFKDDPIVYCSWNSDWQEKNTMLKVGLDTNTGAESVTVDNMYCATTQSTLPETPAGKARYERVMHEYADISTPDNRWGIALINEGKYAFDVSGGRIRMTLHRSPEYPNPSSNSWVNQERTQREKKYGSKVPSHSGLGPISCRFAYFPHHNGALIKRDGKPNTEVYQKAKEFNNPIIVRQPNTYPTVMGYQGMLFGTPRNVQITAIKPNEWANHKSLVIRIAEVSGFSLKTAIISLPKNLHNKVNNVRELDLLEREIVSEFKWDSKTGEIQFDIGKFEVKTFEFCL